MLRTVGTPGVGDRTIGVQSKDTCGTGVGEGHRTVLQRVGAPPELDGRTVESQQLPGVADAAAGDHRGRVGDTEQLRRCAVDTCGLRRADPESDRDVGVGHPLEQIAHRRLRHDGTTGVDLQDQRLRATGFGRSDGIGDRIDGDLVEQTRDLQHVDRSKTLRRGFLGGRRRHQHRHTGDAREQSAEE